MRIRHIGIATIAAAPDGLLLSTAAPILAKPDDPPYGLPFVRLPGVSIGTSTLPIDRPGIGLEWQPAAVILTAQPHETAGLYADDHAKVIPTFELVRLAELIGNNPTEAARRVRALIRD